MHLSYSGTKINSPVEPTINDVMFGQSLPYTDPCSFQSPGGSNKGPVVASLETIFRLHDATPRRGYFYCANVRLLDQRCSHAIVHAKSRAIRACTHTYTAPQRSYRKDTLPLELTDPPLLLEQFLVTHPLRYIDCRTTTILFDNTNPVTRFDVTSFQWQLTHWPPTNVGQHAILLQGYHARINVSRLTNTGLLAICS